ncbi:MAG: D-TA family PLP-dependent enzyme [Eubacteriales bacterium]|nr:D-TA family PLP-dependent enzyme [Eubacteriales bacterium]
MNRYHFAQEEKIPSPALIYYRDQIERNTEEAIRVAGGSERLWPHVKTHKMAEMLQMQLGMGIRRFKCATASEVAMTARAGAEHILWAYPVVGPNAVRFVRFVREFPGCTFYALCDNIVQAQGLSEAAQREGVEANVLLDVNVGMDRTGLSPAAAPEFFRSAQALPNIRMRGLHCYDGHIHDHGLARRQERAAVGAKCASLLRAELAAQGFDCGVVIMGGTPTFPCHAHEEGVFLSPGTLFVSDHGYCSSFPDIAVQPAAAVLARVVSHPAEGLFTIDAGVKAISADASPRGVIAGMEDKCEPVLCNEEHWVFSMRAGFAQERPAIGTILYVIPGHICPTNAMYDAAYVCSGGQLVGIWRVAARDRVGDVSLGELL